MFQVTASGDNPIFFVGVTQRPFDRFGEQPKNVWVLEAKTGRVYQDGQYGPFAFTLGDGDSVTVTCDTTMKTLTFKYNVSKLIVKLVMYTCKVKKNFLHGEV